MTEFAYSDLLPLGPDETEYRLLTTEGVDDLRGGRSAFPAGRTRGAAPG